MLRAAAAITVALLLTAGCTTSSTLGASTPAATGGSGVATDSPAVTGTEAGPAAVSGPPARLAPLGGAAPAQFVALGSEVSLQSPANLRGLGVFLGDAATGAIIRQLLPGTWDGMQAAGVASDLAGNVWVSYTKGPRDGAPQVAGGDPLPRTCANAVVVLRAQGSPRESVFLRTGDNVLIGQAVPSPDGKLLAYTETPCANSPNLQYLRVTDLASGRSWTIGQGLPGCHVFTTPAWSADGSRLIEGYAAANLPYSTQGGGCIGPQTERLLVMDAHAAQPGARGQVTSPDGNCQVTAAAGVAGGGSMVMEFCGRSDDSRQDFVALLPVGPDGRPGQQVKLPPCTGWGSDLAADPSGATVLVAAGVNCGQNAASPHQATALWTWSGGRLRLITSRLFPSADAVSQLSW
jgi:hypothetical protein